MVKHPVILIGGNGSNGLGIARNLGSRGIDVYCVTSNRNALMLYSKYCKGISVIPEIERNPTKIITYLKKIEKKLSRKGVLFPTGDSAVLTLSSLIYEMDNFISLISKKDVIETLVLKNKFYKSLEENGVPHPLTVKIEEENLDSIKQKISFPVFIRPSQSNIFVKAFGKKGFIAYTLEDLRKYLRLTKSFELDVMLQEIIPGPTSNEYTILGYFDKHSKPLVLFAKQKIRKPNMFSGNSVSVSVPISKVASFSDIVVNYLQSLHYRGLFGFEFKLDSRDGCFKLFEINARSMGGNYFSTVCGADHIFAAYRDIIGEKVNPITHYDTGVYQISLLRDIYTLLGIARARSGQMFQKQSNNLVPYFSKKAWSRLSKDDFRPFIKNVQIYFRQ